MHTLTPPPHILSFDRRLRMGILVSCLSQRKWLLVQRTRCSLVWPLVTLIPRSVECGHLLGSVLQVLPFKKKKSISFKMYQGARCHETQDQSISCCWSPSCTGSSLKWVSASVLPRISLLQSLECLWYNRGRDKHSTIKISDQLFGSQCRCGPTVW